MPRLSILSENFKLIAGSLAVLTSVSLFTLFSIMPGNFLGYVFIVLMAFLLFYLFLKIDFEIFWTFSKFIYYFCIFLLVLNLIIGSATRGVVRWIPLGSFTFQPSEAVRPFLILYFANYLEGFENKAQSLFKSLGLFLVPFILILAQPSFGVAFLTAIGFLGVLLGSKIDKKRFFYFAGLGLLFLPLLFFILKPYQKDRLTAFLNPWQNPQGSGYNSVQSMISVGSGGLMGRGLGEGVGTQLKFLPERHTDFIFAAISEEMGLMGAVILFLALFGLFWGLTNILTEVSPKYKGFIAGVLLTFITQTFINIGMNTGMLPITGIPLPFVSQGGSSLIASLMSVALCLKASGSIVLRRN